MTLIAEKELNSIIVFRIEFRTIRELSILSKYLFTPDFYEFKSVTVVRL